MASKNMWKSRYKCSNSLCKFQYVDLNYGCAQDVARASHTNTICRGSIIITDKPLHLESDQMGISFINIQT